MKILLIATPQWTPLSLHLSIPCLAGYLRSKGHEVEIRDLNIEFYNYVLTQEYLVKSVSLALRQENELLQEIQKEYSIDKKEDEYSKEFVLKTKKFLKIKELRENKNNEIDTLLNLLPKAVELMGNKEYFYSLELLSNAILILDKVLDIISLPYYPSNFSLRDYTMLDMKFTYEDIKHHCITKELNMFYDFFEEILPSLLKEKYDYIGLSVGSSSHVVPALTLARLLKQKTQTHINIGGNYFGRVADAFPENPDFFSEFADSVIVEEGERALIELAEYIEGKRAINDVSNLIYLDNQQVKMTEKNPPVKLNDMPTPDLTGFPLDKYLMPEIIMPMHSSRGCYWKKCTFCDHGFGQTYNVKSITKLVEEIKELQQKYGISHFEFVDESLSSEYLENFSQKLIDEEIKINWYCNLRLETEFTKKILDMARKAGLRLVLWGFESGSERIMELIHKGIDVSKRLEIMKIANDADIFNFAFIFFGFPTETIEDALETVNMVCDNSDIIHAYGRSRFVLGKHALINKDPAKFGITSIDRESQEFYSNCIYEGSSGLSKDELNKVIESFIQKTIQSINNPAWIQISYREYLFLYICKYGADAVKQMKLNKIIV